MIRSVTIHIQSSASNPDVVMWMAREKAWTRETCREVTYGGGTFPVPSGGLNEIVLLAAAAISACAKAREKAEESVRQAERDGF